MPRLNFTADEATLLKTYRISSLAPKTWEDVDHDNEESLAGDLTRNNDSGRKESKEVADPLGLGQPIATKDMSMEQKASILISSKSFNAKTFLATVHPNATYQDLNSGTLHLKKAIDSRSEAIRILVEENFDRFVAVKAATDGLYAEMREGLLADTSEYASRPLRDQLKLASSKADQVFLPVVENASKAQKLRTTLGFFERSKFFFNLPGTLLDSITAGRYDAAMRDYSKGKFMLERPGQLLPIGKEKETKPAPELEAQQKRILDKVWASVERTMGEMKATLTAQLRDGSKSVEDHEKTLEILLELSNTDEPVWAYFDGQHKIIMDQMNTIYKTTYAAVRDAKDTTAPEISGPDSLSTLLTTQLVTCIAALETKQSDMIIAQSGGKEVWTAILDLTKQLSEVMLSSLPRFWKIATDFTSGRLKKPGSSSTSRRSPSQVKTMALDIVKLYISLLSEFFVLSDMAVMTSSSSTTPPLFPTHSNSLTMSHYFMKIIGEVQETISEIDTMDISSEAAGGVRNLLESARWKFVDSLTHAWQRDANIFYLLENWVSSSSEPDTTIYISQMQSFQRQVTTAAFKIAGGVDLSGALSVSRPLKQYPIAPAFQAKIVDAFFNALYAMLDGLAHLASDESPIVRGKRPARGTEIRSAGGANRFETVDLLDNDVRTLIVLSNIGFMSSVLVPGMVTELEQAFGKSYEAEKENLLRIMADFDKTLFAAYANPRTNQLTSLLRSGILDPQMDWFETPKPTEIRPYMLGTLVYLVRIHAQLSSVAPSLLSRGITVLVDALAAEALRCFSTIKRFGMGGMLRATLEIEFLQQTLGSAVSGRAAAALAELYNKISKAYERRDKNENLQEHLDGVKKTLQEARRATGVEFLCFRTDKSASSSKSKEGEKKVEGTATPRKKESSSRTVAASGTRTPRKREERPANSNMI